MTPIVDLTEIVTDLLRHAPQWIRTDLASKDGALRERAEDALAAMVVNAIGEARVITVSDQSRH